MKTLLIYCSDLTLPCQHIFTHTSTPDYTLQLPLAYIGGNQSSNNENTSQLLWILEKMEAGVIHLVSHIQCACLSYSDNFISDTSANSIPKDPKQLLLFNHQLLTRLLLDSPLNLRSFDIKLWLIDERTNNLTEYHAENQQLIAHNNQPIGA